MKAPEQVETDRLLLRKPLASDAEQILSRYAGDPEVTRYVGWRTHPSLADTRGFISWSDSEWTRWPAGPFLILARADQRLLGGTGLSFETDSRAMTGYVLAKAEWGRGYATEALGAMSRLAPTLGVKRLYALCHPNHRASWRVLEKCGFQREGLLRRYVILPNLSSDLPCDMFCYALVY
jgi:RimJ/RimL family protein N-acetyltransferase